MTDKFNAFKSQLADPAKNAYAPSTSNTVALPFITRSLYVGTTGNLTVVLAGDTVPITFTGVLAGTFLPLRISYIYTNTTATNLVALY